MCVQSINNKRDYYSGTIRFARGSEEELGSRRKLFPRHIPYVFARARRQIKGRLQEQKSFIREIKLFRVDRHDYSFSRKSLRTHGTYTRGGDYAGLSAERKPPDVFLFFSRACVSHPPRRGRGWRESLFQLFSIVTVLRDRNNNYTVEKPLRRDRSTTTIINHPRDSRRRRRRWSPYLVG